MQITFDTQIAKKLSWQEAVFLGWLQDHYDQTPLKTQTLVEIFDFWKPEWVYKVLLRLEARQILRVQRDAQGYCTLVPDPQAYQAQTQQPWPQTSPTWAPVHDVNLKKHLKRFQNTDNVLHQKLRTLIAQAPTLLSYAQQEGLDQKQAQQTFDKFLHYVSADPDRFWNSDLEAYWRFWVSNNQPKSSTTATPATGTGKRAAIERSAQHAAQNWLKKKSQSADPSASDPLISKPTDSDTDPAHSLK